VFMTGAIRASYDLLFANKVYSGCIHDMRKS
jgi:hypothetical protein